MSSSLQRLNSVGQRRQEARRVAERPVAIEVELEQVLAKEDHHLRPGEHAQVRRQPQLERVLADQPVAERMERRDRRVGVAVRHELVDADLHLVGGLVGEGQREDLGRLARRVAISQAIRRVMTWVLPVPAPARTSSGPSPWVTARRWSAFSPREERPKTRVRFRRQRRVHDRNEVTPGRQLVEWAPARGDGFERLFGPSRASARSSQGS